LVVIPHRNHKTGRVTTKQEYNIETDCTEMVYENVNCVEWDHDNIQIRAVVLNLLRV
jgi:hypothetical protein